MSLETWSPASTAYGVPQKPSGDGWQLTGYSERRIPMNPKVMGSGYRTERIPIYTRTTQAAAPAPVPEPAPPDPIQQAQAAADAARNRQPASYPQPAAPDPMAGIQDALNAQAAQYQQQMSSLQQLMIQQQSQYQSQMAEAQRQQQLMASQAAESQRQAQALQRAFVPNLEPTAAAPIIGDARQQEGTGTRTAAANTLSNLSILTGLGGTTSAGVSATAPLAGLQIA